MLIVVAWGSNPDNFFLHQIDTNMNDAWVGWYSIILNHNIIRYSSILWSLSSLIETYISDVGIGSHLQLHSYWVLLWCWGWKMLIIVPDDCVDCQHFSCVGDGGCWQPRTQEPRHDPPLERLDSAPGDSSTHEPETLIEIIVKYTKKF